MKNLLENGILSIAAGLIGVCCLSSPAFAECTDAAYPVPCCEACCPSDHPVCTAECMCDVEGSTDTTNESGADGTADGAGADGTADGSGADAGYTCSPTVSAGGACTLEFCMSSDMSSCYYKVTGATFTCSSCTDVMSCASAAAAACTAASGGGGGGGGGAGAGGCEATGDSGLAARVMFGLFMVLMAAVWLRRRPECAESDIA